MPAATQTATPELPAILALIDAFVEDDAGLPGFAGSVAVVVKDGDGAQGWYGAFATDRKTKTGFVAGVPAGIDAAMLLSSAGAEQLVVNGELPEPGELQIAGDLSVLRRFFDRYCNQRGLVGFRTALSRGVL